MVMLTSTFDKDIIAALPSLKGFAIKLCRDAVLAEDLVQEAVLKACANRNQFQVGSNFDAWLFTILKNHYFSMSRKNGREIGDDTLESVIDTNVGAVSAAEDREDYAEVQALLQTLPKEQRRSLEHIANGETYESTAKKEGIEVGTVKSRVNRARESLGIASTTIRRDSRRKVAQIGGGARFRRIDPTIFLKPPTAETELGAAPNLLWLPLTRLFIDESYQRLIMGRGVTHIYSIAKDFDWKKFAAVVCAKVGDKYAIIDGQHRTYAAALRGIVEIPCLVVEATTEEQAAAFAAINAKVVKINDQQVYHAAVMAGNPDAVALEKALKAANVRVTKNPTSEILLKPRETIAVGTLKKVLRIYGEKALVLGLRCIMERHARDRGILRAPVIQAIVETVAELDEVPPKALLTIAGTINFQRALIEAKLRSAQSGIAVRHELVNVLLPRFKEALRILAA